MAMIVIMAMINIFICCMNAQSKWRPVSLNPYYVNFLCLEKQQVAGAMMEAAMSPGILVSSFHVERIKYSLLTLS
jgi:hypothetical protein